MNIKSCLSCSHCNTLHTPLRIYCKIRGVLLYTPTYCGAYDRVELPKFENEGPWVEALAEVVEKGRTKDEV